MASSPTPNPRGLYCPECKGVRLTVRSSERPCPGRKIRYRACSACGCHIRTIEIIIPYRIHRPQPKPKPPRRRAA